MRAFMRNLWLWLGTAMSRCRPKVEGKRVELLTLRGDVWRSKIRNTQATPAAPKKKKRKKKS